MKISDILKNKGTSVVTIAPDAPVSELLRLLAEHRIGAVVVSSDGLGVHGIVSERDIVRHLHESGGDLLGHPVSGIMTSEVHTTGAGQDLVDLARSMTDRRIRHVPVVEDGRLVGVVSIGDVVKHRIDDLQAEADHLRDYIAH